MQASAYDSGPRRCSVHLCRNEVPPDSPPSWTFCEAHRLEFRAAAERHHAEIAADVAAVKNAPDLAAAVRKYAEIYARREHVSGGVSGLQHEHSTLAALLEVASRAEASARRQRPRQVAIAE